MWMCWSMASLSEGLLTALSSPFQPPLPCVAQLLPCPAFPWPAADLHYARQLHRGAARVHASPRNEHGCLLYLLLTCRRTDMVEYFGLKLDGYFFTGGHCVFAF